MSGDAPELTAELIVDGAAPQQPVISPDGSWVVYVVAPVGTRGERRLSALWVGAADGSSAPRQLTAGTANDFGPRWAPDSASVSFLSDRTGSVQLHRIRLDGGEAEALTSWRGDMSDACPLADGLLVAVVAADEPDEEHERRRAERDDAMVWGEQLPRGRLRLLDVGTGQQTGAVRALGRIETWANSLAWWQAGGSWHLAYLASPGPNGGRAVFDVAVPAAGGGGQHRNLTAGMDACPAGLAQVTGGPPLALFADGLDTAIYRLDPGEQRFRRVSAMKGLADSLTVSRSGQVAVLAATSQEPKDVHAGPPGGRLTRVSDTRPELRRIRWGTQERLSYQASDGLDLDGLLILPAGKSRADGPFPLITLVHGGPYDRYADVLMLHPHAPGQWLATAGYAVFLPNPRGGQGHGHDFAVAIAGSVGGGEFTDILSGIDVLIAAGVADPDRLGIGGDSHGGFMTAWAIGQTGRFSAALMGAGISDWGMLVATGEAGTAEAELGGSCGWEGPGPHAHDQVSPISFVSRVRTPVLIWHGEDDTNVPLGQAIYFHGALSRFGAEHEFVVYPREGHGLTERHHQLDLLRRMRAWFDRWLR